MTIIASHLYAQELEKGNTLFFLVRHGQTDWNSERRFQGTLDIPLNEVGLTQAEQVAAWLATTGVRFTKLYSSDLRRARTTAEIISSRLGLPVTTDPALREIGVGSWEGLTYDQVKELHPGEIERWQREVDEAVAPGGESVREVQERLQRFFNNIVENRRGEAVLIVSHGVALSALVAGVCGWSLSESWADGRGRMGNTGVSVLSLDKDTRCGRRITANSADHLEAAHAAPPANERTA